MKKYDDKMNRNEAIFLTSNVIGATKDCSLTNNTDIDEDAVLLSKSSKNNDRLKGIKNKDVQDLNQRKTGSFHEASLQYKERSHEIYCKVTLKNEDRGS